MFNTQGHECKFKSKFKTILGGTKPPSWMTSAEVLTRVTNCRCTYSTEYENVWRGKTCSLGTVLFLMHFGLRFNHALGA